MVIVDERIRKREEEYIRKIDNTIIKLPKSSLVYEEISSHVDIFCSQIDNTVVLESNVYDKIASKISCDTIQLERGESKLGDTYPNDIAYNACVIGNYVVHNFEYTDKKILEAIERYNLHRISIKQGYVNCSIAVIDKNSAIVTDKSIAEALKRHDIDVLLIDETLPIRLYKENGTYSHMNGFIGGAITRLKDSVIVFGDLSYIDTKGKIKSFIESKGLTVIDFKNYDVIDYGGLVEI
ncbi:MAG: hypothetical protein PHP54_02375 [Clostridia bacterium]|nr:hypothetical protein [Clostridia bacterium]